jgi:hypothetical protein
MAHRVYYALLSQGISAELAYFLGRHKGRPGHGYKVLKSVRVFWGDIPGDLNTASTLREPNEKHPDLLWEVEDVENFDSLVKEIHGLEHLWATGRLNMNLVPFEIE